MSSSAYPPWLRRWAAFLDAQLERWPDFCPPAAFVISLAGPGALALALPCALVLAKASGHSFAWLYLTMALSAVSCCLGYYRGAVALRDLMHDGARPLGGGPR